MFINIYCKCNNIYAFFSNLTTLTLPTVMDQHLLGGLWIELHEGNYGGRWVTQVGEFKNEISIIMLSLVLLGSYITWSFPCHVNIPRNMVTTLGPLNTLCDTPLWFIGLHMSELFIRYYNLPFILCDHQRKWGSKIFWENLLILSSH